MCPCRQDCGAGPCPVNAVTPRRRKPAHSLLKNGTQIKRTLQVLMGYFAVVSDADKRPCTAPYLVPKCIGVHVIHHLVLHRECVLGAGVRDTETGWPEPIRKAQLNQLTWLRGPAPCTLPPGDGHRVPELPSCQRGGQPLLRQLRDAPPPAGAPDSRRTPVRRARGGATTLLAGRDSLNSGAA